MCAAFFICKFVKRLKLWNKTLTELDLLGHLIRLWYIITSSAYLIRIMNITIWYFTSILLAWLDHWLCQDAAAAALFTACKIEDTLKKSREIVCGAYNLKRSPAEQMSPDEQVGSEPSGLRRVQWLTLIRSSRCIPEESLGSKGLCLKHRGLTFGPVIRKSHSSSWLDITA